MQNLSLKNKIQLVYGLYAAALLLPPLAIAGFILAYQIRNETKDSWLGSHCRWQMQTFWIGLAGVILGFLTAMIYIGWLVLLATSLWILYRVIKGWIKFADQQVVDPFSFDLI